MTPTGSPLASSLAVGVATTRNFSALSALSRQRALGGQTVLNDLNLLRGRVDVYAQRALDGAIQRGLQGANAGNWADRYLSHAGNLLDSKLQAAGSEFRVRPQFARTARGVNIYNGARPLGSGVLDAAITDRGLDKVYSGWDMSMSARWNSAATNAKYMRLFSPEEGFIREINPVIRRP